MKFFIENEIVAIVLVAALAVVASASGCSNQNQSTMNRRQSHGTETSFTDAAQAVSGTQQLPEGGATSGGGYVYGYEANPWFLANTREVTYCIDIDLNNFGLSRKRSTEIIRMSIDQWKGALKKAEYKRRSDLLPSDIIELGTQEFIEVPCSKAHVDLRFQLGTIAPSQVARLGNPRKYVASAVQTAYDDKNMKGQGFIYVASEKGALRPDDIHAAKAFWSDLNGLSLNAVLLHELGHVFGLQHRESSPLMNPESAQYFISDKFLSKMEDEVRQHDAAAGVWKILEQVVNSETHTTNDLKVYVSGRSDVGIALGFTENKNYVFIQDGITDTQRSMYMTRSNKFTVFEASCDGIDDACITSNIVGSFEAPAVDCDTEENVRVRFPSSQQVYSIEESFDLAKYGTIYAISLQNCKWEGKYRSLDGEITKHAIIRHGRYSRSLKKPRLSIDAALPDGRIVSEY